MTGLREVSLTGGNLLETPRIKIRTAAREHVGAITKVDHAAKKAWIDAKWLASSRERIVEIGDVAGGGAEGYVTSYTATRIARDGTSRPAGTRSAATWTRPSTWRSTGDGRHSSAPPRTCQTTFPVTGLRRGH